MSIQSFRFFTPSTPWVRPASIRAWQSEIDTLQKAGVMAMDQDNNGGAGAWGMLAGLVVGFVLVAGMSLKYKDTISLIAVGVCLFFTLALGGVSLFSALSDRRQRAAVLQNPVRARLTLLQESRGKRWARAFRENPSAYTEFLEASQGPVPLLFGDIRSLQEKYAIADPEGGLSDAALCGMVALMGMAFFGLFIISAAHLH
jgi:hypothetical protein